MKKKWYAASALLIGAVLLGGCAKKATPENLLIDMAKNASSVKSVSGSMNMDMGMGTALGDVSIGMNMDMESTKKPEAMHMKGNVAINYLGTDMNMDMEMYEMAEGETYAAYTCINNVWTKESSDKDDISFQPSTFKDLKDMADSFTLSEEKTKVEGQECFELKGKIKGEDLEDMVNPSMFDDLGAGEEFSEDMFDDLEIPCTVEIYSKTIMPARIQIDMSDVLKDFETEEMSVKKVTMDLMFKEYDKVKKIELPKEAENAPSASEGDGLTDMAAESAWSSSEVKMNND